MSLTITHTLPEGTLVDGTARGDGTAVILKSCGFRWGRTIGQWFIPHSRDRIAQRHKIDHATSKLRDGGFEVEVSIDNSSPDAGAREERRAERAEQRAEGLTEKSARLAGESQAASEQAHRIGDMIPFGQPILVGHHSEGRHRRDLGRIDSAMSKSVEAYRESEDAARRARVAERNQERRRDPGFVGNRIRDKETDERKLMRLAVVEPGRPYSERELTYKSDMEAQLAIVREDLAYWRGVQAELVAQGVRLFTKDDFKPGDAAKVRGRWERVVRANKTTLTIDGGMFPGHTLKYPYTDVSDRRDAPAESETPDTPEAA